MDSWPSKSPAAVLDYFVDWQDDIEPTLLAGETVATSVWTVLAGSVTIIQSPPITLATTDTITGVALSGGVLGETCELRNTIVTSAGRTYDKLVRLRIKEQ